MTIEQLVAKWDPLMAALLSHARPLDRAAIWGQTPQESRCDPTAEEIPGSDHGGKGLWQWTGSRFTQGLRPFATARGKPWQDEETQVRFACHELLGDHAKTLIQVAKTSSAPAAAGTVMAYYEAPAHWQEELQKPGSTSARLDVRIKGTERALAVINAMAAVPVPVAPKPKGAPMTDTPTTSRATPAQIDSVVREAEALGNQAISQFMPGAAPIISLIEHMIVNPMLPSLEASFATQINSNAAAQGIFNLAMLGLGFLAGKFLPAGVTPTSPK